MRRRLMIGGAAVGLLLAPFGLGQATSAQAMTCAADPPIDYGCKAVFYVVGSVCQGTLPTKPPTPPIVVTSSATVDLCPPLG